MKSKELLIGLFIIAVVTTGLFFYFGNQSGKHNNNDQLGLNYIGPERASSLDKIKVVEVWEMPGELTEISSNVLIGEDRMACIQDNDGIIYIYDLKTKSIENKIRFAGKGDYEGLSLVGKIYYVLKSDGSLYEVDPKNAGKPVVQTYNLPLGKKSDTEAMFYDSRNNRLLIGVKEKDPLNEDIKGVYSFDLTAKKMSMQAVFRIEGEKQPGEHNENGSKKKKDDGKEKKGKKEIKPSEIAIHPQTGELYILNGPESELLIADSSGNIKSSYQLDDKIFPQPEGMCFTSAGELYISSEGGNKGKAVIAKVQLH